METDMLTEAGFRRVRREVTPGICRGRSHVTVGHGATLARDQPFVQPSLNDAVLETSLGCEELCICLAPAFTGCFAPPAYLPVPRCTG
jgi:hypothetical protein